MALIENPTTSMKNLVILITALKPHDYNKIFQCKCEVLEYVRKIEKKYVISANAEIQISAHNIEVPQ